jgi:uncharacterized protein YciI
MEDPMAYAIIFFDKEGEAELREQLRSAHIDYIKENVHRILASGGLLTDDGTTGHGGLIILDTDSRAEADQFVEKDPFFVGGLYGRYTVSRWRKAFFNRTTYLR